MSSRSIGKVYDVAAPQMTASLQVAPPVPDYMLTASSWGQEELDAIARVVESGYFTMGKEVHAFEQAFARHFDKRHAVMVNSGSSANLASIAALFYRKDAPLECGDEVIVPAISWSTTYHPLQQYGLRLRFVDVELESLNMDVDKLEAALTPRTRMVMAVSILGNPAKLDVIRDFCDRHDLIFMEDNCESLDAVLPDGRKTGTLGDLSTASFFFSHHISTMEGGMVLTDDDELHHLLLSLRAHGWTRDLPETSPLFEHTGDDLFEAYRFILPGYNLRPLEFSGAIGQAQLEKLDAMTMARRRNWQLFQELFGDDPRFIIQKEYGKSSAFAFTLILEPELALERRVVFDRLKAAGIGFRIITGGCFLAHDVIRHYDYSEAGPIENAFIAHRRGFFVGNHPSDLRPEIEHLHRALKDLA